MEPFQIFRGILGLSMNSEELKNRLHQLQMTAYAEPTIKIYSDAVYANYFDLGMSIMYSPKSGYRPKAGAALAYERLEACRIDLYNSQEQGSRSQTYSTFVHLPFAVRGLEDRSLQLEKDTTGKDVVDALGEPSRKGGGDGPAGGSIGIWCEWTSLGLMFEFESRGPQAWEKGKDSRWTVLTPSAQRPVIDIHRLLDPGVPFDFNFVFPIKVLENERVKLVPFVPAVFTQEFYNLIEPNSQELLQYLPFTPWRNIEDVLLFLETTGHRKSDWLLFAVLDLTQGRSDPRWGEGKLAGMIALINCIPHDYSAEVGAVIIGKPFQRTHVTTNATGLLLEWCFSDLKLRRVQWQANALNAPSVAAAQKMGFKLEGIIRWQRAQASCKKETGVVVDQGYGDEDIPSRHTAMLSICWDDWRDGVAEILAKRMSRTQ
ncbi:hypothetical protein FRC17_011175 [Serendipita sp. 399]|nr:hypothetical protein FRC17_011175 [Serendipita sp. 399]